MKRKVYFTILALLLGLSSMSAQKKITVGVIQYKWDNIDKSFAELKELGFGSCQMNWNTKMDANFAEQLKAASQKYGIKVTTLVGVPGHGNVWNFRQGPSTIGLVPSEGREGKIAEYHRMVDFCVLAGIPAVHSHFGFIPEDMASQQYKEFIPVMQDLANYAKSKDKMIYLETGQETPITLIRAIKDIGTGNVFINCDLANLLMYGKANSLDAVKLFGSLIKEFHVKDGKYPNPEDPYSLGKEVKIPTGDVNFPAVIAQLKKQGYEGSLTIECELRGDNQEYLVKTRKYLQKLLDKKN